MRLFHGAPVAAVLILFALGCDDDPGTTSGQCSGTDCEQDTGRASSGRDLSSSQDSGEGDFVIDDDDVVSDALDDVDDNEDGSIADDAGQPDFSGGAPGGSLTVSPTTIFFPYNGVGYTHTEVIRVWNETDQEVIITSAEVESTATGFSLTDAPVNRTLAVGEGIAFNLLYTAASAQPVTADVLINNSVGSPFIIPVSAADKAPENSCIRVNPTQVNFGTAVRGSAPVARVFEIVNCGDGAIQVLRLQRGRVFFLPTPNTFSWQPSAALPILLNPSERTEVIVTFTAGRAGPERGLIEVVSNVEDSEVTNVNLSATSEPPPLSELDVHIQLNWNVTGGSDVDLHFYAEGADLFSCDDCFYSNPSPDWGAANDIVDDPFLDTDDLEGPGPENINVDELQPGTYIITVHYYSDTGSSGEGEDNFSASTDATVDVYLGGTLAMQFPAETLSSTNVTWDVARLEWPGGGAPGTLTALNSVYNVNTSNYSFCSAGLLR